MDKIKAIQSVNEIKELMERSSKFVSLSGLTGIMVGMFSIVGAWVVNQLTGIPFINNPGNYKLHNLSQTQTITLVIMVAGSVILASIISTLLISYYKSRKAEQKLFNKLIYRLIWNFGLPLVVGGIFCIALLYNGNSGLTSSVMLLFYGFSLVNVSKYTFSNVGWLGYAFLALGLVDAFFEGYALLFWTIGFGGFHIVYGLLFYFLYEKDK